MQVLIFSIFLRHPVTILANSSPFYLILKSTSLNESRITIEAAPAMTVTVLHE